VPARCSPRCRAAGQSATVDGMPYYLVEVRMTNVGQHELERVKPMLKAAQSHLRGSGIVARLVASGLSREDGRLLCLIEASDPASARRLVSVALLPAGRVREITPLAADA